ncbi:MAG: class I SAM-dependent methyltransferase [Chloroflexi bacterium]|nr:class I SAM-dependent methyltransferase [Chloroflexota bacterium]
MKSDYKHTRLGTIYRDETIRQLDLRAKHGRVLDVGCHDGYILHHVDADLRVGVDLRPMPVYTNIDYVCADGCALPFEPGSFDHIFALDVLEHIADDAMFARSLINMLDLQGELFITTTSKEIRLTPRWLTNWISQRWGHTLRAGYIPAKLKLLFQNEYFSVSIHPWNAPWYRFFYLSLRILQIILPQLAIQLARKLSQIDSHYRKGLHGFYHIEVFPGTGIAS